MSNGVTPPHLRIVARDDTPTIGEDEDTLRMPIPVQRGWWVWPALLVLFVVSVAVSWWLVGCQAVPSKAVQAEATYTGELVACVEQAQTLAESKACREAVNAKWGIIEIARRDAGGR